MLELYSCLTTVYHEKEKTEVSLKKTVCEPDADMIIIMQSNFD